MATTTATRGESSGWAEGLTAFAGLMMILIGGFQFFEGLAAVIKDQFYVVGPNYIYDLDVSAYGWIHMIWGVVVCATGFAVMAGRTWGRVVGIGVIIINATGQVFYIPYYPILAGLPIAPHLACLLAPAGAGSR